MIVVIILGDIVLVFLVDVDVLLPFLFFAVVHVFFLQFYDFCCCSCCDTFSLLNISYPLALPRRIFHLIFYQGENVSSRVKAMQGDIDLPGLGLSDADKAILSSQVIVSCDQMCVLFSLSSPQIETASHIHFLFSPI